MRIKNVWGRMGRRKPLLSKKNIALGSKFVKNNLDEQEDLWKNVLWKIELFGFNVKCLAKIKHCLST